MAGFGYRADHGTLSMREFASQLRESNGSPWKAFSEFPVFNARPARATLDSHGFCLVPHTTREDWRADREAVVRRFAEEVVEVVRQVTGADHVFMANPQPVIRVESAGSGQAGPVLFVHTDFTREHKTTLVGAVEDLQSENSDRKPARPDAVAQQIAEAGLTAEDVRNSRVVMLNTWRPVMSEPLRRFPLAVTDCRSIDDGDVLGARTSAWCC